MSFDMDVTSLPEGLTEAGVEDPTGYQEETGPSPPKTGNYLLRVADEGMKIQTDQDGTIILDNGYPVVVVNKLVIVETGREVYLPFQKFSSKPIEARGGGASRLADLIRAHDDQLTWTDASGAVQVIATEP